jgi:hypothetical protein
MTTAERLLADIETFLKAHDMSATTFGRLACRDPHTVRWLRDGNGVTSSRIDTLRNFMRDYRPSQKKVADVHAA